MKMGAGFGGQNIRTGAAAEWGGMPRCSPEARDDDTWPPVSIRYAHHPGGTRPQSRGRRLRQQEQEQEQWSLSVWFSA
ncbi:hypothetical protein CKAH01_01127 [Colletotrichum kahawae]|uniref:Uncharacterized protein n=1 Tax=Colletotrichum kahawae TaxID=34407 RepID=A0AAD9YCL4_COLKA|nr:hypothetical protein CKAH01_01127 [Colletotrichum kahawae]